MADFLKSIFRRSQKPSAETSRNIPIEEMSFEQIVKYSQSLGNSLPFNIGTALVRRLYHIALYDHHVPQQHRANALRLLEALNADLEKIASERPGALEALQAANQFMVENAALGGVGSLAWKMEEESIPASDVISYIMRPDHGHLVENFLKITPNALTDMKHLFAQEFIKQRVYSNTSSVVIMGHALATKGDKAAAAIFTREEYDALLHVPDDYAAGRSVFAALGLLPKESNVRPFPQIQSLDEIVTIIKIAIDRRRQQVAQDARLNYLSEPYQMALKLGLLFLRVYLARRMLGQLYGAVASQTFLNVFTEESTKESLLGFDRIAEKLATIEPGTPIDFVLMVEVMGLGGIDPKSEDDYQRDRDFIGAGAAWLNQERAEFLDYLRFLLRWVANPIAESDMSAADEQTIAFLRETYVREGAAAGIAQRELFLEDWIGKGA